MLNDSHIWRGAQERLRQEMSSAQFETWLRGTQLRLDEDGAAELQVRTTFAKELLESRYRERIEAAIASVTGQPCALEVSVCGQLAVAESDSHLYASPQRQVIRQARPAVTQRQTRDYVASPLFRAPVELVESDDSYPSSADVVKTASPRATHDTHGKTPRRASGGTIQPIASAPVVRGPALDGKVRMDPRNAGSAGRDDQVERMAEDDEPAAISGVRRRDDDPGYAQPFSIPAPRLNARYTFSTFIVGAGNQLAHAASAGGRRGARPRL